jgi:hypothetical protein
MIVDDCYINNVCICVPRLLRYKMSLVN